MEDKVEYLNKLCPDCNKFHLVINSESKEIYCPAHWCRTKNNSIYKKEKNE